MKGLLYSIVALAALGSFPATAQNVILIIGDDIGVDSVAAYAEHPDVGPTPTLDALASQGVLFRNAWAYPVCSPFRASVLVGLHPTYHGVGHGINLNSPERMTGLDPTMSTLARVLKAAGFRTAAVGKWHMGGEPNFTFFHPNLAGFDLYQGFFWGGVQDYYHWRKVTGGVMAFEDEYATTDTATDAISQLGGSKPFFLWLAFNAVHGPWQAPPQSLHHYDLSNVPLGQPPGCYFPKCLPGEVLYHRAMTEAMDTELSRILANVDFNDTTVIFVGDNGTTNIATAPPFPRNHAKGTVYEGGVNVPLIVAGEAVAPANRGTESDALIQATDIFATVVEIAGASARTPDSLSFVPYLVDSSIPSMRDRVYTEMFVPNGGPPDPFMHDRAIRDHRYKLVRRGLNHDELYDLATDPFEQSPIDTNSLDPALDATYLALAGAMETQGRTGACANGIDDDGDGKIDFPADDGCFGPTDFSELADADSDYLNDDEEIRLGTSPVRWDTDGDGWGDGAEIGAGKDPTDPASHQQCGLGFELVLVIPLLSALRRKLRRHGHVRI